MGFAVVGRGNVQAGNAVADLAQADAQPRRRDRAVKTGGVQGAHQNIALLLVQPRLQVVWQVGINQWANLTLGSGCCCERRFELGGRIGSGIGGCCSFDV